MSSDTTALLIERDELEQKLRTQIMEVTFNKINGDQRVMSCTFSPLFYHQQLKKILLHRKRFVKLTKK